MDLCNNTRGIDSRLLNILYRCAHSEHVSRELVFRPLAGTRFRGVARGINGRGKTLSESGFKKSGVALLGRAEKSIKKNRLFIIQLSRRRGKLLNGALKIKKKRNRSRLYFHQRRYFFKFRWLFSYILSFAKTKKNARFLRSRGQPRNVREHTFGQLTQTRSARRYSEFFPKFFVRF